MTVSEIEMEQPGSLSEIDLTDHVNDGSVTISVDSECLVSSGAERLAALLDLDVNEIHNGPVGLFVHTDDINISPLAIWRSGQDRILRFKHRTDGYVRIRIGVARSRRNPGQWDLRLRAVDAEILEFVRGETGTSSTPRKGETSSMITTVSVI